jgi:hypothetical protein
MDDPAVSDQTTNASSSTAPLSDNGEPVKSLEFEETPIINPDQTSTASPESVTPPLETPSVPPLPVEPVPSVTTEPVYPKRRSSVMEMVKNTVFIVVLFAIGVVMSVFLKQYMPNGIPSIPNLGSIVKSTPTPVSLITPSAGLNPFANWKTYQVTSGISKQPIAGITYMLPADILSPICDGGNCASSGTYLPGGTRFTVDARGSGQLLPDSRGKILTDQGGREFTMKVTTVAGRPASEFSGVFAGTTSGGYAFSQMRGVMVALSDTISIEFNHFTPTLVNADFTADDLLFDKILQSITISTPVMPISTSTPTLAPTPPPGCFYTQPQCITTPCGPTLICNTPTPIKTTPTP